MKILRNKQVGFILKAELTHLILFKMSSSTEMNDISEECHMVLFDMEWVLMLPRQIPDKNTQNVKGQNDNFCPVT